MKTLCISLCIFTCSLALLLFAALMHPTALRVKPVLLEWKGSIHEVCRIDAKGNLHIAQGEAKQCADFILELNPDLAVSLGNHIVK
jgi:hypothetical protein